MLWCPANLFQVIMLTADAQTFLHTCRPAIASFFQAQENILKLIHAGVGKKQRRVIFWNQRRTRNNPVPSIFKKLKKGCSDLIGFHLD